MIFLRIQPDIIRIGTNNINQFASSNYEFGVAEIVRHPEYRGSSHYNDIALINLNRPADLSSKLRPACLWQTPTIHSPVLIATGYGTIEFGGPSSDNLLKVELEMIDKASCSVSYAPESSLAQGISDGQLCAYDETGERDTCQGDSGGPLQLQMDNRKSIYHIVGITSFGKGCAFSTPGVYTRASYYLDWIESVVWP